MAAEATEAVVDSPYQLSALSTRTLLKLNTDTMKLGSLTTRNVLRAKPTARSLSALAIRSMLKVKQTGFKAATINVRNLLRVSPDFGWIDVFSDLVFPHDISEGSDGATRFNTQVNEVASGHDQRISLWDHPLMEYNVAYGVRTMEQLHDLIRFFRVMKGRANAFRFYDNVDHTSTFATAEEAREAPDPEPFDQQIGVGDGINLTFQLVKNYGYGDGDLALNTVRPILKPIDGTVLLGVDGQQVTWFYCDPATGIVTVRNRVIDFITTGINISKVADADPAAPLFKWRMDAVDAIHNPLPVLMAGEWFSTTGTLATNVGARGGTAVLSTPSELVFTWPDGPDPATLATNPYNVHFTTDNTPRVGQIVTAGYEFHVPVRFDVDKIPIKLEYYGVGSGNDITLVEVRPEDAQ